MDSSVEWTAAKCSSFLCSMRAKHDQGWVVVAGAVGSGLSARVLAEQGVDLLATNVSRIQEAAGHHSVSGLLPVIDANAAVFTAAPQVISAAASVPVLAGVCAWAPGTDNTRLLERLQLAGFAGIQNYPTVGSFDGTMRWYVEKVGFSFEREVALVAEASHSGLITAPFVFTEAEAAAMTQAGADILVCSTPQAETLEEANSAVAAMARAAASVNPDIVLLSHGGAIQEPGHVRHLMTEVPAVAGFFGARALETVAIERALSARLQAFTGHRRRRSASSARGENGADPPGPAQCQQVVALLGGPLYDPAGMELLSSVATPVVVHENGEAPGDMGRAVALVARYPARVGREILARAPRLVAVCASGRGTDQIDIHAATEQGIVVMNNPGCGGVAVAEHTIALMLMLAKRIPDCTGTQFQASWSTRDAAPRIELSGRTLGLVGLGHVGREVAVRAIALGMSVLAYDPYVLVKDIEAFGVQPFGDLPELLAAAEFVSVHAELTHETRHMFDEPMFAHFRAGAFFINTARGAIVDTGALVRVLEKKDSIVGAALDVYESEPPPAGSALSDLPNVILTPHVAGMTAETRRELALSAAWQIGQVLRGERPEHLLNDSAWPLASARMRRYLETIWPGDCP
jgi:phosphoglycerate dehydrogenase-like enzyme/predicted TIM-barrel enzyme